MERRGFLKKLAAVWPTPFSIFGKDALYVPMDSGQKWMVFADGRTVSAINAPKGVDMTITYLFPQPGQKLSECVNIYLVDGDAKNCEEDEG